MAAARSSADLDPSASRSGTELGSDVQRPRRLVGCRQPQHLGRWRRLGGGLGGAGFLSWRPPRRATANAATASGLRRDRSGHHTAWAGHLVRMLERTAISVENRG